MRWREWATSLARRVRSFGRRRALEQDFDDEIAFHLAMREEALRASGTDNPSRLARRRFGNATRTREHLRNAWTVAPALVDLLRDFRYTARTLIRNRAFTIAVVLTLGLGIGTTTAFFTVVNAVLIRPIGYADPDRLVTLQEAVPQLGLDSLMYSAADFDDLRRRQKTFENVAAFRTMPLSLGGDGEPEPITGGRVSADLFHTLGIDPILGRTFSADEERTGANVAVLSWRLWQRRFGGERSIAGRHIRLDRDIYTVLGVMPAGFSFPHRGMRFYGEPADVWIPLAFTDVERRARTTGHTNGVVARLRRDVSLDTARAELDTLARRIGGDFLPPTLTLRMSADPLRQDVTGSLEAPLLALLAAVGLVLLVACANVANLVLSRAVVRRREFCVRSALGASRWQLARLLLCEAALLSAGGGAIGLALAYAAVRVAPAILVESVLNLNGLTLDARVLAFATIVCLGTTVAFALVPLAAVASGEPGNLLRAAATRTSIGRPYLQRSFVVLTTCLACVLVVGAGMALRSFAVLSTIDVGFRSAGVLVASAPLPRAHYGTAASVRTFYDTLQERLSAVSGVRAVALTTELPLAARDFTVFTTETDTNEARTDRTAFVSYFDGPYFESLGVDLKRGRSFTHDEHALDRSVVVVNETLAGLAWPGLNPLGRRIKWGPANSAAPWLTVLGVIADVADRPIGQAPAAHAWMPFRQVPDALLNRGSHQYGRDLQAVVLTDGNARSLTSSVRAAIATLDPALAIVRVRPLDDDLAEALAPQRFAMQVVGVFAAMALVLAAVGLHGLVAWTMAQRRTEIGIRRALGAGRRSVVVMIIAEGAWLAAIGLAAGVPVSLALARLASSFFYRANPYDLTTFVVVSVVLSGTVLAACAVPAWRAARVEPTEALRVD